MEQVVQALVTIAIGVGGCAFWYWASNTVLDTVYPARGPNAGSNINKTNLIRPWLFVGPAVVILAGYLIYPVFNTLYRSFMDKTSSNFVGTSNFTWLLSDGKFHESMLNQFLWLLVVPALATFFGLLAAQLTDRIRWGNFGKSLIFMPMAISFVGAGVIWKFVYANTEGNQIGLLNAVVQFFGGEPQHWLQLPFWNNIFLMVVLVWIQAGFAMVILSAALRGIPEDTIEAAIIDGANPFQIFFKIKVPQIASTIGVVWTTITITVLKVFDIVYVMTNGEWGTQVLANMMYDLLFDQSDYGRGSAVAIVIMILVLPIMWWNVRNARKELR
jgi:alpha-glucoside transport system permease protein